MVTYNKFNITVENMLDKVMDMIGSPPGDTYKIMLTNVAPVAANSVKVDLTEIAAGNGYTAGGTALTSPTGTRATGTITFAADSCVFTASGSAMATFRYYTLYDDTPSSPAKPLVSWWDHGSAVTLNPGDTFTINFNNDPTAGTIFTLV
jgi:hypothetical protein